MTVVPAATVAPPQPSFPRSPSSLRLPLSLRPPRPRTRAVTSAVVPGARAVAPAVAAAAGGDEAKLAELLAKAEKQEQAKRYNEYVKTLHRARRTPSTSRPRNRATTQRPPTSTRPSSRTRPRRSRCYEAILAHRRRATAQAIEFLRQSYEKRRDWEKLIGSAQARPRRCRPARRARREVPRDRQARHRAGQEARGLHRALERGHRQRSRERRRR